MNLERNAERSSRVTTPLRNLSEAPQRQVSYHQMDVNDDNMASNLSPKMPILSVGQPAEVTQSLNAPSRLLPMHTPPPHPHSPVSSDSPSGRPTKVSQLLNPQPEMAASSSRANVIFIRSTVLDDKGANDSSHARNSLAPLPSFRSLNSAVRPPKLTDPGYPQPPSDIPANKRSRPEATDEDLEKYDPPLKFSCLQRTRLPKLAPNYQTVGPKAQLIDANESPYVGGPSAQTPLNSCGQLGPSTTSRGILQAIEPAAKQVKFQNGLPLAPIYRSSALESKAPQPASLPVSASGMGRHNDVSPSIALGTEAHQGMERAQQPVQRKNLPQHAGVSATVPTITGTPNTTYISNLYHNVIYSSNRKRPIPPTNIPVQPWPMLRSSSEPVHIAPYPAPSLDTRRKERPRIYDLGKMAEMGFSVIGGRAYNEQNHRVCAAPRDIDVPCKRIVSRTECSWHGPVHLLTPENTKNGLLDQSGNFPQVRPSSGNTSIPGPSASIVNFPPSQVPVVHEPRSAPPRVITRTLRWNNHEHFWFLLGLQTHGHKWAIISKIVRTRNTLQVQSHAQKYFERQRKVTKKKSTIHDLQIDGPELSEIAAKYTAEEIQARLTIEDEGIVRISHNTITTDQENAGPPGN